MLVIVIRHVTIVNIKSALINSLDFPLTFPLLICSPPKYHYYLILIIQDFLFFTIVVFSCSVNFLLKLLREGSLTFAVPLIFTFSLHFCMSFDNFFKEISKLVIYVRFYPQLQTFAYSSFLY